MARRKKPQITGRDPEYTSATHQFTKLPTHKPDEPKDAATVAATAPSKPKVEQPVVPKAEPKPEEGPKPLPAKPRGPKKSKPAEKPTPDATTPDNGTRRVELLAALTPDLHAKLQALEGLGIAFKDAMSVAGRRATKEFEVSSTFVEKTDVERLPTSQAYRSSKSLPVTALEQLHEAANPLRLSSDGAMVRGQFEPLFWQHLEAVLKELNDKYSK